MSVELGTREPGRKDVSFFAVLRPSIRLGGVWEIEKARRKSKEMLSEEKAVLALDGVGLSRLFLGKQRARKRFGW